MGIQITDIIDFLLAFFGGGGLGYLAVRLFMRNEAKEALKDDVNEIVKEIKEIKDEIKDDYVTCKFCNMQHENLNAMLKSINSKLDILIEKK